MFGFSFWSYYSALGSEKWWRSSSTSLFWSPRVARYKDRPSWLSQLSQFFYSSFSCCLCVLCHWFTCISWHLTSASFSKHFTLQSLTLISCGSGLRYLPSKIFFSKHYLVSNLAWGCKDSSCENCSKFAKYLYLLRSCHCVFPCCFESNLFWNFFSAFVLSFIALCSNQIVH